MACGDPWTDVGEDEENDDPTKKRDRFTQVNHVQINERLWRVWMNKTERKKSKSQEGNEDKR